MSEYNYSIIIPHKNIPQLLQRCLASIPIRDDVQIIVVDDNSDSEIVDFENFPGLNRANTEVYFDKTGRGAGHARNVGLQHSKGKWLVFADADDFFVSNVNVLLDEYVDSEVDVVYFYPTAISRGLGTNKETERTIHFQSLFDCDEKYMRFLNISPWAKIIRADLVYKGHFSFSEVRWGNDIYFMTQVAVASKAISKVRLPMYVLTEREGSLTNTRGNYNERTLSRFHEDLKAYNYANANSFNPTDDVLKWHCRNLVADREWSLLMTCMGYLPRTTLCKFMGELISGISVKGKIFYALLMMGALCQSVIKRKL